MKRIFLTIAILFASFLLTTCKKAPEVNISQFEIVNEIVTPTTNSATITGSYNYGGKVDELKVTVGKRNDFSDGQTFTADLDLKDFVVELTDLSCNTEYKYRYEVSYGADKDYITETHTFTTIQASLPIVTTAAVSSIGAYEAVCGGNVSDDGGAAISARGVCWSINPEPTLEDVHTIDSCGLGQFESHLTGLALNTKYYVRAYAINSTGTGYGSEVSFTTSQNISLPTVTTSAVTNITQTTAQGGGNVTNDGNGTVTDRGVCWSTSHNPTTSNSHTSDGSGTGGFTSALSVLTTNTTYYVRAYATNAQGTAYGSELSFTTGQDIVLPTITTTTPTNITAISATSGGNITNDNGNTVIVRGVCWSTSQSPTVNDNHTTDGSGVGNFTSSLTGLSINTTYYIRAYATTSCGTAYGEQKTFTTQNGIPTVTTADVTNIGRTYATSGGNITSDGGLDITARGICWSTSQNPTIMNSHTTDGEGTGDFTSRITGLAASTTYYVRAYATNSHTTTYGSQLQFSTLDSNTIPEGAIDGLFTINSNGDQVYFSQGNLQYQASTNTWRFAEHQWDYVGTQTPDNNGWVGGNVPGSDKRNISSTYSGWIDLFGWGTSGYDHGAVCYQPWSISTNYSDYYAYGNEDYNLCYQTGQADWGYNPISNGGNQTGQWRTLTGGSNGEWEYIFETRSTTSGIRFAKATVNNVKGIILVPDDWSSSTYTLNSTNYSGARFSSNTISQSVWTNTLEPAGCIFLPVAGGRLGASVNDVGRYGSYWSSSYVDSSRAYYVFFSDSCLYPVDGYDRSLGVSVRLAR